MSTLEALVLAGKGLNAFATNILPSTNDQMIRPIVIQIQMTVSKCSNIDVRA
jgi:hypothetical protein